MKKKKKAVSLYKKLKEIRAGRPGSITYYYANDDSTKKNAALIQKNINTEVFYNSDGGVRSLNEVINVFEGTRIDNGAAYFIVD